MVFHDPAAGQGMVALEGERARADAAEAELAAGRARVREPEGLLRRQGPPILTPQDGEHRHAAAYRCQPRPPSRSHSSSPFLTHPLRFDRLAALKRQPDRRRIQRRR